MQCNTHLRNEFESVVAEFIVIAVEEGAGHSAEWSVFFDLRLTPRHVMLHHMIIDSVSHTSYFQCSHNLYKVYSHDNMQKYQNIQER